ncbi:hypothetical protein D9M68_545630 [compost metagenome]
MYKRNLSTAGPTTMRDRSTSISPEVSALVSNMVETSPSRLRLWPCGISSSTCTMMSAENTLGVTITYASAPTKASSVIAMIIHRLEKMASTCDDNGVSCWRAGTDGSNDSIGNDMQLSKRRRRCGRGVPKGVG